jgi:mannose-1-phosphate guanylyltransferase
MLQETMLRITGNRSRGKRPIVICNDAHRFLVAEQIRGLGLEADVILEPEIQRPLQRWQPCTQSPAARTGTAIL